MAEQNVSEHQVQKAYNNFCVRDEKYLHEIRTRAELSERLTTRGAAVEKVRSASNTEMVQTNRRRDSSGLICRAWSQIWLRFLHCWM